MRNYPFDFSVFENAGVFVHLIGLCGVFLL